MVYASSLNYCMTTALSMPEAEGVGAAWGKENMKAALLEQGFSDLIFHAQEGDMLVQVVAKRP